MYPYILCVCGRSLGDIYELFKHMRIAAYKKYHEETNVEVDPLAIPYAQDVNVNLHDTFAALNIDLQCCKAKLLTQVEFKELC